MLFCQNDKKAHVNFAYAILSCLFLSLYFHDSKIALIIYFHGFAAY